MSDTVVTGSPVRISGATYKETTESDAYASHHIINSAIQHIRMMHFSQYSSIGIFYDY